MRDLKSLADEGKTRLGSGIVAIVGVAPDGKAGLVVGVTEDLTALSVPVLFIHGEDDQIVPISNSAHKAIKLVRDGTLRTYPGLSHGLFATHPDVVNPDLLAFAAK